MSDPMEANGLVPNPALFPGFPPARIEAAARAMWFEYCDTLGWPNGQPTWDEIVAWGPIEPGTPRGVRSMMEHRDLIRAQAEAALATAYPELASGEAWVAPREATEAMIEESYGWTMSEMGTAEGGKDSAAECYRAMREAHLKDHPG